MARAKYQVLVIPYFIDGEMIKYGVFKRSDMNFWQFIAGGGEDEDRSVLDSAKREACEEAGINHGREYISLETKCSVPTYCFKNANENWGSDCLVIPEYCFGVLLDEMHMQLSQEHLAYEWVAFDEAYKRLKYDSNRTALWELDTRIKRKYCY